MTQRRADERLLTRGCRGGDRPGDFPVGACTFPTGKAATSQWELRKSHWEIPLGAFGRRVGLSNRGSKSEWAHGGSASWWGGWRLARRGGPRRLPLGGASGRLATTVRTPLPVGYLPSMVKFVILACSFCSNLFFLLFEVRHVGSGRRGTKWSTSPSGFEPTPFTGKMLYRSAVG
jgi:hypothetical protein